MTSISSLNLSKAPAARRSLQPAKPEFYVVCTWLKSSSKNEPLSCRIRRNQISKLTVCRVMSEKVSFSVQTPEEVKANQKIEECTAYIKDLLTTFGDGRLSVSPYDTSVVALIKDVQGRDRPQFPSCLEWIGQNQKADGSWGDDFFCIYDRIVNTLACVVALKSWNVHADKIEKGVTYIKENVHKLKDASAEHVTCGFEIVVPAALERAKDLDIKGLPYDDPIIKEIIKTGDRRLEKIPKNIMYKTPTPLLYSLEGLKNLEWEKILKLLSPDGSCLGSPASTAFMFMQTKYENCLRYIDNAVKSCGGQVPNSYPVDIFTRLWAVDRLQRLGISHFFKEEIKSLLDHIKSFWTEKGAYCARDSNFADIDDTCMGIRLLKMHGYKVDPNALEHFKQKDGAFSCYIGQTIESASPIYNLYRAAQLRFPGEDILEEASKFSYNFLQEKLANDQIQEKWVISDHFIDEIRIGLKMPWYATLPRVEAAYYLEHYAGSGDVWIGKANYRMIEVSNDTYKELATLDYNRCQAKHQLEWSYIQEWYQSSNVKEFGISKKELLVSYFLAAATIFERGRTQERIMWVKTQIVSRMITSFLNKLETTTLYSYSDQKTWLLTQLGNNFNSLHKMNGDKNDYGGVDALLTTFQQLLEGFDDYTHLRLRNAWSQWLMKLHQGEGNGGADAELQANTLNICGPHIAVNDDVLSHNEYTTLSALTAKICQQLSQIQDKKTLEIMDGGIKDKEVEQDMQALVKLVLEENGGGVDRSIKQTFLSVFKTFYYSAYHDADTTDLHIFKVLFAPVE